MPDTPAQFDFLTIDPAPGVYGDAYTEESRQGLDGHRYQLVGRRGEQKTVTCILSSPTEEIADAVVAELTSAMGSAVVIKSILRDRQWTVWLHRPRPGIPRPVVSTRTDDNWRTDITLDITTVE